MKKKIDSLRIHVEIPFEPTPVSAFISPGQRPELYPGTRPAWSFCFIGDKILPIRIENKVLQVKDESNNRQELEVFLKERTGISLWERFAVAAVGSNACPGRLADPDKYGQFQNAAIPVLHGWMDDVVSVYAPRIASYHSVPSTIMGFPNARTKLWVTLLTEEELHRMDKSEGRGIHYELVELPQAAFHIRDELLITPFSAYYQSTGLRHLETNNPILLDCFEVSEANLPRMSQMEVQEYLSMAAENTISLKEKNNLLLQNWCIHIPMPEGARIVEAPSLPSQYVHMKGYNKINSGR
jgi:hypothetical protein